MTGLRVGLGNDGMGPPEVGCGQARAAVRMAAEGQ